MRQTTEALSLASKALQLKKAHILALANVESSVHEHKLSLLQQSVRYIDSIESIPKAVLGFLDSTVWVGFIMIVVILQLVVTAEMWLSHEGEMLMDLSVIVFFSLEVALRLGLLQASHSGGACAFFSDWYNCLDAAIVAVDLSIILANAYFASGGSGFGASSARLARFGKFTTRLIKMGKFRRLLVAFRLVKAVSKSKRVLKSSINEKIMKEKAELLAESFSTSRLIAVFEHYDKDGSGSLDREEFDKVLKELLPKLEVEEVHSSLGEFMTSSGESMDLAEWVHCAYENLHENIRSTIIDNFEKKRQDHEDRERLMEDSVQESKQMSNIEEDSELAPLHFDEAIFVLKASATQLVSAVTLTLCLLPFYVHGLSKLRLT